GYVRKALYGLKEIIQKELPPIVLETARVQRK
ncbi:DUF402 domain-containing protein, partial [Bacillus cereus]|nr:DUF402 domain-containing protein [Bacillus cereus]